MRMVVMESDFFSLFRCILYGRDGDERKEEIIRHGLLAPHREAFVLMDPPEEILRFTGEYAFLSGKAPISVYDEGITYTCVNDAYRAAREREKTPDEVLMERLVRGKFQQHPELMEKLILTGKKKLINGGRKDTFWGLNLITWEGENHLGEILMRVRDEEQVSRGVKD